MIERHSLALKLWDSQFDGHYGHAGVSLWSVTRRFVFLCSPDKDRRWQW